MSKGRYWAYRGIKEKITNEFSEYLGEELTEIVITKEEEEYYEKIKGKIKKIFNKHEEKTEKEYRDALYIELKEREVQEREEKIEKYNFVKKRYEINGEIIIELKKEHLKEDINDLAKYMQKEEKMIGILVAIRKKDYKIYMILKEEMLEDGEYICYDGERQYKFIIHEKRCIEMKKEKEEQRREEIQQNLPKENIEELIKEGKTYEEISEIYNIDIKIIKECCKIYGIQSNAAKNLEERKKCPEDYLEILNNPVKYAMKQIECKRKLREAYKYKKEIESEKGIYGIFDKITNKCIYIGSSENCRQRLEYHKEDYARENTQWLHEYMRKNGGWENYVYIVLEKRQSHIGLNVIERIWWEAAKPVGNKVDPMRK